MAWQDRSYYRDPSSGSTNPLMWLLTGRVPLFTAFGIRVYAHASLVIYAIIVLLLGMGPGFYWQDRVLNVTVLFAVVLMHEFGHCFTARWVGGEANEILMHPLGGLAYAMPPRRPWPTFLTVAGGPAVNLIFCILSGALVWAVYGFLPLNPIRPPTPGLFHSWVNLGRYAYWFFNLNWMLLCFNLLPIFPLDGGQMVQTMMWPKLGYYRSMLISCTIGMVGSVLLAMVGIASGAIGLTILAVFFFMYCMDMRRMTIAVGPEEYADGTDYSAAYDNTIGRPKKKSKWRMRRAAKRARKIATEERTERERIDAILAKVSAHGMNSLTWLEKRTLKKATEAQRERDREMSEVKWQ
jgi:stage IV sporulation protein FB